MTLLMWLNLSPDSHLFPSPFMPFEVVYSKILSLKSHQREPRGCFFTRGQERSRALQPPPPPSLPRRPRHVPCSGCRAPAHPKYIFLFPFC